MPTNSSYEDRVKWVLEANSTEANSSAVGGNATDWVAFYEERVPFDFDSVIVFLVFMILLVTTVQVIKMVERRAHRYAPIQRAGSKVVSEVELTEMDMEITEGTDEDMARRANV